MRGEPFGALVWFDPAREHVRIYAGPDPDSEGALSCPPELRADRVDQGDLMSELDRVG